MAVDLHVHTTASDGALSPAECVVEAIKKEQLNAIAITDHDTVDGIAEAMDKAKEHPGFIVVPGIEISSSYKKCDVHVLGYYIDYRSAALNSVLTELKNERYQRGKRIIDKLNRIGINIRFEQVVSLAKGSIGRPHIAEKLIQMGYANSIQGAFDKYLKRGRPAYVPRKKITPDKAITMILQAGGVPVLAHPSNIPQKQDILDILKLGFQGVEVYYPMQTNDNEKWLENTAKELGLIITGGSDYHGYANVYNLGDYVVDDQVLVELQEKRRANLSCISQKKPKE